MIVVIDSGGANLDSVLSALKRLNVEVSISVSAEEIQKATHVVLPGVGSADKVMSRLHQLKLVDVLKSLTQPVLGICVGMQIMFEHSEEGNATCLSVMEGSIKKLSTDLTLPHMGWNTLEIVKDSVLMKNLPNNPYLYFVHSFYAPVARYTSVITHYGLPLSATVEHRNFFGVQFHPERSGKMGHQILKNFVELTP